MTSAANTAQLEILHRDDLHEGGFAGLREHRLVMDRRAWGLHAGPGTWNGVGNFIYLADARFNPKGDTRLHPHHEIDVISIMVDGRIHHEGSLEHGGALEAFDVQVQRAGGEGFTHNEVNPDETRNRMLQLWVLPEEEGQPAGYKKLTPAWGGITRVYGGNAAETGSFPARTFIDVAMLKAGQQAAPPPGGLVYMSKGKARLNGNALNEGDLIRGAAGTITADADSQIVLVGELT
ncbi:MAG: pilus assembly protein [Hyphomicrobiales bacterium]|nr:MAG: pilus assembly protein [Hyphomicrobiales bacterium]